VQLVVLSTVERTSTNDAFMLLLIVAALNSVLPLPLPLPLAGKLFAIDKSLILLYWTDLDG